jgi:Xaa-Pro aminopeptidase
MSKKNTTEITEVPQNYPKLVDNRLRQLRFSLEDEKVDALVLTYLPNIRYLTNFSGTEATVFIDKENIYFITDDRYEEQIKTELYPLPDLKTFISRDPWAIALDKGILDNVESLAFESDRVSYHEAVEIRNRIRPVKFKPVYLLAEKFTIPKDPMELEYIQQSCDIAEKTYEKMLEFIKPGISETDIAIEIAYQSRKLGSEGDPFSIIAVSGARGCLIHGTPSDKKIKNGDIVILDFGCKVNGFCSDITRTFAVGKATKEQKQIYKLIYEAQSTAISEVRPSMNGKILDAFARNIIEKEGLGNYFQHSLGHGIGLVPHELPIITFRKDDQIIPENCVLAIEPGVYLPDKFGMRVEDEIFVTRNGATRLTNAPAELLVI